MGIETVEASLRKWKREAEKRILFFIGKESSLY